MADAVSLDQMLRFSVADRNVRGRFVRLRDVFSDVASAHDYPPAISKILGEALCLTALLGSLLKDANGQLTMQAQTENGVVDMMVCDYKDSALRGYVKFDAQRLAEQPADPTLFGLFGKGYLAITFDQAVSGERYQGIVPLEGETLADAAQSYFSQSEQLPTFIRLAYDEADGAPIIGGFLVQHLADGEEGGERLHVRDDHPDWEHVLALVQTVEDAELTDRNLPAEELLWRFFHQEGEIRTQPGTALVKGCRCNIQHIRDVLGRFSIDERRDMADDDGNIIVDCEFCSEKFAIQSVSLEN